MSTLDLDLKVEDRLFRQFFYWFVAYVIYGSTYISEIEHSFPVNQLFTHINLPFHMRVYVSS